MGTFFHALTPTRNHPSGAFDRLYTVKSLRAQNNSIEEIQRGAMNGLSNTNG